MNRAASRTLGCLWVLLAWIAAPLVGQEATRSGFWVENGVGTGTSRNACASCGDVTSSYGRASHIRVGWALSPRVAVGAEVFAYQTDQVIPTSDGGTSEVENVSIAPIVLWFLGDHGFFLKGGVGLARGNFEAVSPTGARTAAKGYGSGLTLGVGLDVPLWRWLALTANFATYITAVGDVDLGGVVIDDVIATVYEAGIAVTLR